MRSIMNNKKGLSAIVATLLIILLVLVAVGILWAVLNNVIQSGADTVELNQKCLEVKLEAGAVSPVGYLEGNYSVTLSRKAGGEAIGGVKINFLNATASSGVVEFGEALSILGTSTRKINTAGGANGILTNATKMEYTVYFVDDRGKEQVCSSTNTADLS